MSRAEGSEVLLLSGGPESKGWRSFFNASLGTHLTVVLALAVAIRVIVFLVSCQGVGVQASYEEGDTGRQIDFNSPAYLNLADSLVEGRGYGRYLSHQCHPPIIERTWFPELLRTPGYPTVVALLGRLTGHAQLAVIIFQHLLGLGLCVLLLLFCRRLFGPPAGLLAGLLMAVDIQGLGLANMVLTDSMYGVLLFISALLTCRLVTRPSAALAVMTGLLLGAEALVRPSGTALPLLLAGFLLVRGWLQRSGSLKLAAGLVLVTAITPVAGWTIHNGLVCGDYTLSSIARFDLYFIVDGQAVAFDLGLKDQYASRRVMEEELGMSAFQVRHMPLTAAQSSKLRAATLRTAWQHKTALLRTCVTHALADMGGPDKRILQVLGLPWVSFGLVQDEPTPLETVPWRCWFLMGCQVLFLVVVYGLVCRVLLRIRRRHALEPQVWVCLAFAAYVLLITTGLGDPRLRWPAIPLLILVAASSLCKPAKV